MGVTPQGPVEAKMGARTRICAAGKALEGMTDKHTNRSTGIIERCSVLTKHGELYKTG